MTEPHKGGSSGTTQLLDGNVVGEIVPDEAQLNKQTWLKIVRAFRGADDWELVYQHRVRMSAYLNNVVQMRGAR